MLKPIGQYAAIGIEMGIAIGLGTWGGSYLDELFGTAPVLFWIGFALGLGAAANAVIRAARMAQKEMDANDGDESAKKD